MKWLRSIWTDPVWSKVIAVAIVYIAGLAVAHLPAVSLSEVGKWFAQPVSVTRGDLINTVLTTVLLAMSLTAIYVGLRGKRRDAAEREAVIQAPPMIEAAPAPAVQPEVEPKVPRKFEPDTFALTPARCRALLVLFNRIDSITTLHDLYQEVAEQDMYVDPTIQKGQVQHDMDDAERAGIVEIERIGNYTQRFRLTVPDGRDWVLSKQPELGAQSVKGLKKRDPRTRYF